MQNWHTSMTQVKSSMDTHMYIYIYVYSMILEHFWHVKTCALLSARSPILSDRFFPHQPSDKPGRDGLASQTLLGVHNQVLAPLLLPTVCPKSSSRDTNSHRFATNVSSSFLSLSTFLNSIHDSQVKVLRPPYYRCIKLYVYTVYIKWMSMQSRGPSSRNWEWSSLTE